MKKTIVTIISSALIAVGGASLVFFVGIEKKDEEISTLSSKVQELSEDIEIMNELNDSSQAKLSKRNNTITELEKRIESLEKESTKLKGNVSQKEDRIKELTNEIERRKKNEAELSKRVSIKEEKDRKANLAKAATKEKAQAAKEKSTGGGLTTVAKTTPTASRTSTSPSPKGRTMTMEATAYGPDCYGCSGITATGLDVRSGNHKVIAVDPNVIPLGTKVHVEGYGYAVAADTGGAIKGNIIDVLMESEAKANSEWGRRQVKVTILE